MANDFPLPEVLCAVGFASGTITLTAVQKRLASVGVSEEFFYAHSATYLSFDTTDAIGQHLQLSFARRVDVTGSYLSESRLGVNTRCPTVLK